MTEKIKITFLGTSGMIPDEKRNHPAFFVQYANEGILVDCGEGTQTQFRKAKLNPCSITKILLTHWHGDHTLGLPGLLKTISMSEYTRKLEIYGPRGIKKRIAEMFQAFGPITEYPIEVKEVYGKFFETKDFYLEAEEMDHNTPCNAYALVVKENIRIDKKKLKASKIKPGPVLQKLKLGKDIVYEGKKYLAKNLTFREEGKKISFVLDTVVNGKIVPLVKNSNVFVCESSFHSELEAKAKEYKHMTSKQAAEMAKKAGVKKLILTHLSQRYENQLGRILQDAKKVFKNVSIANDLDVVLV